jgi:hypothetical protein
MQMPGCVNTGRPEGASLPGARMLPCAFSGPWLAWEDTLVEVLATLIVLALMAIPLLNMLVGALAWGLTGFLVGLAISLAIPLMLLLMLWVAMRL